MRIQVIYASSKMVKAFTCPLGCFYPSAFSSPGSFNLHGKSFSCVKQCYQRKQLSLLGMKPGLSSYWRAKSQGDEENWWAAENQQKGLGAKEGENVLVAKFIRTANYYCILRALKENYLQSSTHLITYGCSLHSLAAEFPGRWEGENLLGTLLQQRREEHYWFPLLILAFWNNRHVAETLWFTYIMVLNTHFIKKEILCTTCKKFCRILKLIIVLKYFIWA